VPRPNGAFCRSDCGGASGAAAAAGRGRDMTWLKVVHTGWAAEAVGGLTQVVGGGDGAAAGAV